MSHAVLSPSGSSRWINCPPSVRMEEAYPNESNEHADEGTAAHELGEYLLKTYLHVLPDPYYAKTWLADIKKGKYYSKVMLAYMEGYAAFVLNLYNQIKVTDPTVVIKIEQRVNIGAYAPESFGTVDVQIIGKYVLIIIDLKYGKGVPVDAEGNTQTRLYALGALLAAPHPVKTVSIYIYQPRLESITNEVIEAADLIEWATKIVKPAAIKAFNGLGSFNPGKHCRFCRARITCKAFYLYVFSITKYMSKSKEELTAEEITHILNVGEQVKKYVDDVTEYALNKALKEPNMWPEHKVIRGRAYRSITDPQKAASILLTDAMLKPADIYKPKELINLTDLEALLGKKEFTELLGPVVTKPLGAPKIVPISAKGDPIDRTKEANDDFKSYLQ